MNTNISAHLPVDFAGSSRVWIYQSSRIFQLSEVFQLEDMLNQFIAQWNSHGEPVKGYANLFFGQFIVLMADETQTGVGGCSTDSSIRLVKDIEKLFNVDLLNRQMLAFINKDKIQILPLAQLKYSFENGFIGEDTLFFDNTVLTKDDLIKRWITPVGKSWLAQKLGVK